MGILDLLLRLKTPSRKVRRILMVGLDNAGKTCILKRLTDGEMPVTTPTQGFNIKTLTTGRLKLSVWDIGGQKSLRNYWRQYFGETDVLIYVIDVADEERIEEASTELMRLLEEEKLAGLPLLIFANKKDLVDTVYPEVVASALQLIDVSDRHWHLQPCSAKTGEGLDVGIAWIEAEFQQGR